MRATHAQAISIIKERATVYRFLNQTHKKYGTIAPYLFFELNFL